MCIGEKEGEPQFTITDILPHLGKDQMAKTLGEAISGEDMNVLAGSLPLTDGEGEQLFKLNIMNIPPPAVRHCGKRFDFRRAGVCPRLQGRGHRLRPAP